MQTILRFSFGIGQKSSFLRQNRHFCHPQMIKKTKNREKKAYIVQIFAFIK